MKTILIFAIVLLSIGLVSAGLFDNLVSTTKIILDKPTKDILTSKNIDKVTVNVPLPKQICAKYKQITKKVPTVVYVNVTNKNKPTYTKAFTINVTQRIKTNDCDSWRDLTSDEVNKITDRALQKKINELTIEKVNTGEVVNKEIVV